MTVIELDETLAPLKREWNLLGSFHLGGQVDRVHIQDFARA